MTSYRRFFSILLVAVVVCASMYSAGFLVGERSGENSGAVAAATVIASVQPTPITCKDQPKEFKVFWEAWSKAVNEFYLPDKLDPTKMTYGAIRGMLESLGDAHTGFASPEQAKLTDEDIKGSFDGIGVTVEMKDGYVTVVAPLEGSPGEKAGIRAGDIIVKIDDHDATTLSLLEAVALIRGPRGTSVTLTMARSGQTDPVVVTVTRAEIVVESVRSKMLDGNLLYVKITTFSEPTTKLLVEKLKEGLAQKPVGLILDLRNNPGGLLDASVDVASQFLSEGVVLYQEDRDSRVPAYVKKGGLATSIPMVVLVNKGSASASEIVAGALQDTGRAKLIGDATFGKDTVQNVHHLSDNSTVRISVARWLTPKIQDIHEKGLQPDIAVKLTQEDVDAGKDPQLDRAVQELLAR